MNKQTWKSLKKVSGHRKFQSLEQMDAKEMRLDEDGFVYIAYDAGDYALWCPQCGYQIGYARSLAELSLSWDEYEAETCEEGHPYCAHCSPNASIMAGEWDCPICTGAKITPAGL